MRRTTFEVESHWKDFLKLFKAICATVSPPVLVTSTNERNMSIKINSRNHYSTHLITEHVTEYLICQSWGSHHQRWICGMPLIYDEYTFNQVAKKWLKYITRNRLEITTSRKDGERNIKYLSIHMSERSWSSTILLLELSNHTSIFENECKILYIHQRKINDCKKLLGLLQHVYIPPTHGSNTIYPQDLMELNTYA